MYFSIRYEAANEAQTLLQKANADVTSALEYLDSTMKTKFDYAHWDGNSRAQYDAKYKQWTTAAQNLNSILNNAKLALSHINDNYQQLDQRLSKGWQ